MVPQRATPHSHPPGRLACSIVALAETPENVAVDDQLRTIAQLAVDTVGGVGYASITVLRGGGYTTVAASSEIALAVDEAQYADGSGPCMDALDEGSPVVVPDVAATMSWPGFVRVAVGMGLHAAVSIPLLAARGAPVAALNLYGRDAAAMSALTAGIGSLYDTGLTASDGEDPGPVDSAGPDLPTLDPGAEELLAGLAEAMAARATIQVAIAAIMARTDTTPDDAYLSLCVRAAEAGESLTAAAIAAITPEG